MPIPDTITIDPDLNGPIGSANGGVAAGLLGGLVDGAAKVRLFRPPPLGQPMQVRRTEAGFEALFEEEVALTAESSALDVQPPAVSRQEAVEAQSASSVGHVAVTCVICGPDHLGGLKLAPGPVGSGSTHANTWTPSSWLDHGDGTVRPEMVWGALDCPGAIMLVRHYPDESMFPALGTMIAEIAEPIRIGEEYVVVAWPRGRDGRKLYAGTAILDGSGRVVARSAQVCIAMPFGWAGIA